MEELKTVLLEHAKRYPRMQPTDAVKLIYQNEFGGGHLIRDPQACLEYLRQEYDQTPKDPRIPLYESIGNGLVRVHLAAVGEGALEALGQAFLRSAQAHQGDLGRFRQKLEVLRQMTLEGLFGFDLSALDAYLSAYEQAGFPPVSHSQAYRAAYGPAYRVLRKDTLS